MLDRRAKVGSATKRFMDWDWQTYGPRSAARSMIAFWDRSHTVL